MEPTSSHISSSSSGRLKGILFFDSVAFLTCFDFVDSSLLKGGVTLVGLDLLKL